MWHGNGLPQWTGWHGLTCHTLLCVVYLMCQALFIVLLLGWLFVPVYLTAGVSSSGCIIIVCTIPILYHSYIDTHELCCVRWSRCPSTWRKGSEGPGSASTSPLSLCSSTFSPRSQWVILSENTEKHTVCVSFFIPSPPPSLCVSLGGHVFRSCVYPAGIRVEHLRGCHHPSVNNSLVHCYRYVCGTPQFTVFTCV